MDAHELLEQVHDSKSFLCFVRGLIDDRLSEADHPVDPFGRGPKGWENHTIEGFLDAAARWAETTEVGATQGLGDASPWKRFAAFLWCGKIYE